LFPAHNTIDRMARTAETRNLLRELDVELAGASQRSGRSLVWTAQDRELLTLIGSTIDRRVDLAAHYAEREGDERSGPSYQGG
jgi:hypothetical protein